MNRDDLWQIMDGVADRHIAATARFDPAEASALRERSADMQKRKTIKHIALVALAAALLLALGVTAYAAGWLDSIFGQAAQKFNTNDASEKRIETAAAAVSEAPTEPEKQTLPAFDGSSLTLQESWYDGEGLLLGVDLDAAAPEPVIGYEPEDDLLGRITQDNLTYGVYHATAEDLDRMRQDIEANYAGTADYDDLMAQVEAQQALLAAGDPDDLDLCLDTGYITQQQYEDSMAARTERGAAAGLHYESAIWLDRYMQEHLTGEQYEAFWQALERDGAVCVATQELYLGDHMLAEGMDIAAMSTDVDAGTFVEAQAPDGDSGRLSADLPAELQGLDELHIQLKVKGCPVYYYMQLDGRAYALYDQAEEQLVPFTIPNSAK